MFCPLFVHNGLTPKQQRTYIYSEDIYGHQAASLIVFVGFDWLNKAAFFCNKNVIFHFPEAES